MYLAPRTCRQAVSSGESPTSLPLENFRQRAAYVLLGEPGMGKTSAFETEAAASGGLYLRARDFATLRPREEWRERLLFIDGLDEMRAGQGDGRTAIDAIRARLDELAPPGFRLSCREADWLGTSDAGDLAQVSPDRTIAVLHLDPLDDAQAAEILRRNHGIDDPYAFLERAGQRGIKELLANPQTLRLLAEAVADGRWPETRSEAFALACRQLADEPNREHRNARRLPGFGTDELLAEAARLCALLLLANLEGVALDRDAADDGYPVLAGPDFAAGSASRDALATRLFATDHREERRRPLHRSVAEFLAARYLAEQIARGLPLARVLALMLARDDGIVSDLRGVHAWLAVRCPEGRRSLIDRDPLGVVLYGDARQFTAEDKLHLLRALQREAGRYPWFRSQDWTASPFGALATPDMAKSFQGFLASPERSESHQSFIDCILEALAHGQKVGVAEDRLLAIVRDKSYFDSVRNAALRACFRQIPEGGELLVGIANEIRTGLIEDKDDELLGTLLAYLYPRILPAGELARHLHATKNEQLIGAYACFWEYTLFERAPPDDLPCLLNGWLSNPESLRLEHTDFHLCRIVGRLLTATVEAHGDTAPLETLYGWLGAGLGKYDHVCIEQEQQVRLASWIGARPERYCALLKYGLSLNTGKEHFGIYSHGVEARLYDAAVSADFLECCLREAENEISPEIARYLFDRAIRGLMRRHCPEDFPLEFLEQRLAAHPTLRTWLEPWLQCEWSDRRREDATRKREHAAQENTVLEEWRNYFRRHAAAIADGSAPAKVLYDLVMIHDGRYFHAYGNGPQERLLTFLGNEYLAAAALQGLRQAIERNDLPKVDEVFQLAEKNRQHFIHLPCLLAMDMLAPSEVEALDEPRAKLMFAFRLTYDVGKISSWFNTLVVKRPGWVAEVLERYARRQIKAGKEHVAGLHALARDGAYAEVARCCLPGLLRSFPLRLGKTALGSLRKLLAAGLRHLEFPLLLGIVEQKLEHSSLEARQRIYWLAAAAVLDPARYESLLIAHVGKSQIRALALAACLEDYPSTLRLSESAQAQLIRLIAPHVGPQRPRGGDIITPEFAAADRIRELIRTLGGSPKAEAQAALFMLLGEPALVAWCDDLRYALETQRLNMREASFTHPTAMAVAATLANREPTNPADLAALVVQHLETIAEQIRHGDTNTYRQFWRDGKPRPENDCRDLLLDLLRPKLAGLPVEAQKEGYFADDKRADIRISAYGGKMVVPLEIKRDCHRDLWTAIGSQLQARYTRDPAADGHGIYLVLWFGGKGMPLPLAGPRPDSAASLQTALENSLGPEERSLITIRVLDCTWPLGILKG